jgi:ceramide glucosyltransferase
VNILSGVLLFASLFGLVSSTVYLLLVLEAARRFRKGSGREALSTTALPPVSVLKPLHGMEPQLERNLESFFRLKYPDFELIFGARHSTDPALKVVDSLRQKYRDVKVTIVLTGEPMYPNAKVYTLERMVAAASASYFVITDSDVRVEPDCLREVVAPLLDPDVGVVTCLYRGVPAGGLWSKLEALGMSVEMPSGVFVANMLEGMKFALGPTMATRRDVLDLIGGVSVLGQYLADDYVLGNLAHACGKKVILSRHIIQHVAMNTALRLSFSHQVRWMRSTRFSRRTGHVGTGLTYAVPFGLLGSAGGWLGHNWKLALGLLGWAFVNRVIQSITIGRLIMGSREALRLCWLYPVRDLTGFVVWCASFAGSDIVWRNERYRLLASGKMVRIPNEGRNTKSTSGTQEAQN